MAEYTDREGQFDASLGNVMGGWMLDVAKADLARQQGWLEAIQTLTQPDKDGKIPTDRARVWHHRGRREGDLRGGHLLPRRARADGCSSSPRPRRIWP